MDEAAVVLEEEGEGNVVYEDDGAYGNNEASAENPSKRDGVFCCQKCGEAFREEAAYLNHLQHHSQEDKSMCLENQLNDKYEDETHHDPALHDVDSRLDADGEFTSEDTAVVKDSGTKPQTFQCEECGKSYGVMGHLLNHKRSHKQASKSVFHDLEHLKKKSFQCEFCGRSYSRATALDAHRRCHEEKLVKRSRSAAESLSSEQKGGDIKSIENHNEEEEKTDRDKKSVCSCGKSFATLVRLKTHQRFSRNSLCSPEEMFEKQKKSGDFQCSQCDKTFSGQIALINHERWHTHDVAENKFTCEECGKVFMTLTFYYRHQRLAHSKETPSKSFLHQVCQLQKKSFECKDCGLKFSRASALHSHELQHTDVFKETEKETVDSATLLPQQNHEKNIKCENKVAESTEVFENPFSTTVGNHYVKDTEDDIEIIEPGDLIVKVISSSDSEDDSKQDRNSDLELLCESDHDIKEDGDMTLHHKVVSKPDLDLKIVQVDYGEHMPTVVEREWDNMATEERFDCPDCYRWFTNPSSLRVHRMWHGVRKRRQLAQGQSVTVYPLDLSCREKVLKSQQSQDSDIITTSSQTTNHYVEILSSQKRENVAVEKREYNPKKTLLGPKLYHCEQCGKGFWSLGAFSHHKQSPMQCTDLRLRKGFGGSFTNGHSRSSFKVTCPVCGRKFRHRGTMALHMRKHENGNHKCELCNRSFRLLSGLLRHRAVHNSQIQPPPVKSFQYQVEQLQKNTYSCPDCGKLFSRAKALQFHMKSHGYETGHSPPSHRSADTLEDLQCPTCLAHFNKKSSLRAHRKLCTKKESKTEPLENSSVDVIQITDKKTFQLKDKNVENKNKLNYKCKVCDRSFSVVGALNFHKRIHTERHKSLAKAKALVKKSKLEESNKGLFSCLDCGRRFVSNSALGSHKRWNRDKPCSKSSLDEEELHPTNKTDLGPFKCNKCDKTFFNLCVLQCHQMCNSQCQNTERNLNEVVITENKSSEENVAFSCTECDQTFEQGSLLDVHIKNVHRKHLIVLNQDELGSPVDQVQNQVSEKLSLESQTRKPGKLRCPLCSMSFVNVRGLRAHKWQAHSKRRKRGKKSNYKVKNENVVVPKQNARVVSSDTDIKKTIHVNIETKTTDNDNAFGQTTAITTTDSEGDSVFVAQKQAEQEMSTHEVEVISPTLQLSELATKCLYKCDKCGKAFSTPEQLGNHKTKAKSRPFSCALCCSGFWTENQLQQHFIWHDKIRGRLPNELRFRINAASAFTQQTAHVYSSDSVSDSALTDPLVIPDDKAQSCHKCPNCGDDFISHTAMQKHKRQYCNTGSYHCSACPRTFREIQELIDHHQECTSGSSRQKGASAVVQSGDNSLTCLECGTSFLKKSDLHQHYIEHARCVYVTHNTDKN